MEPRERRCGRSWALLGLVALLVACATGPEPLMEAPVLYHDGGLDPYSHLEPESRSTTVDVFFATGREPRGPATAPGYGTGEGAGLRVGSARVRFGDEATTWSDLYSASTTPEPARPLFLQLDSVTEYGLLEPVLENDIGGGPALGRAINAALERVADPELLIYVHGAKVEFARCTVRTGEIAHFAGRNLVCMVYDWPSHSNILSYVFGSDRERAERSADHLRSLLVFLAEHTRVRRIHVLAYSAGGIVAGKALADLRRSHPDASPDFLRQRYRIGCALFAAADVPVDQFLEELPLIHDLSERVTVTLSGSDDVLGMARNWMGGEDRIGTETFEIIEIERHLAERLPGLEVLDVSYGQEDRGFDIGGHHYWYRHPWVASDVILNVRTDLPPARRGLVPCELQGVWFLPTDYPERARAAGRREIGSGWGEASERDGAPVRRP